MSLGKSNGKNNADMRDNARTHAQVYTGRSLLLKLGPESSQEEVVSTWVIRLLAEEQLLGAHR